MAVPQLHLATDHGRSVFLTIITRDDRGSRYVVTQKRDGEMRHVRSCAADALAGAPLGGLVDAYVTHNGFAGSRRLTERCRQVNSVVCDVDMHDAPLHRLPELKQELLLRLAAAFAQGELPWPTMTVDTGRGCQLLWSLESSTPYRLTGGAVNDRGLSWVSDVARRLDDALEEVVGTVAHAKVDRSVHDLARVIRIPGTINSMSGTCCAVVQADPDALWTLPALDAALPRPSKAPEGPARRPRLVAFEALCVQRMRKLEDLQRLRDHESGGRRCEGLARNNMAWLYLNSAWQVYGPEEALSMALAFNEGFMCPLPSSEIEASARNLERRGEAYTRIGRDCVVEKLALTPEEIEATDFFAGKKATERAAAKARTARRRAERDARVLSMLESGMTQSAVAAAEGLCRQTVAKIARTAPTSPGRAPWSLKEAARRRLDAEAAAPRGSAVGNVNFSAPRTVVRGGLGQACKPETPERLPTAPFPGLGRGGPRLHCDTLTHLSSTEDNRGDPPACLGFG